MSILHAGEIGRFSIRNSLASGHSFLLNASGELYQIDVENAKNYFLSTLNITTITAADSPYSALTTDDVIVVNAAAGNVTINLFALAEGEQIRVKKIDSSSNTVIITGNGSNIDGAPTLVISSQYVSEHLIGQSSEWGRH